MKKAYKWHGQQWWEKKTKLWMGLVIFMIASFHKTRNRHKEEEEEYEQKICYHVTILNYSTQTVKKQQ